MQTRLVRVPGDALGDASPGHDVHVAEWPADQAGGRHGPAIVCAHGLGGSHLNWSLAAPELHRLLGGPVFAPDLAGFGRTPLAGVDGRDRSAALPAQAELLAGIVRTLAPGTPVLLFGNSMGALLGLLLAARHPDLVAGLVLVNPPLPLPLGARLDREVVVQFSLLALPGVGERVLASRQRRMTPEQQVRTTLELSAADSAGIDTALVAAHSALAGERRGMPHAHRAFLQAARSIVRTVTLGRRRLWRDVERIAAPALHVQGARDRLVRPEAARQLLRRRADWEGLRYDDLGHVPMIEDPPRFAADAAAWAERALPREPSA